MNMRPLRTPRLSVNPHPPVNSASHPADTAHLTDEQFSDLLAGGSLDSLALTHLESCACCRGEAEAVLGGLRTFNNLSLRWAEVEAPRRVPVPSWRTLRWGTHPVRSAGVMAAATAVVLAVGLRLPLPAPSAAPPADKPAAEHTRPTGNELEQDNRLLASIDRELTYAPQPAVPVVELRSASRSPQPSEPAAN